MAIVLVTLLSAGVIINLCMANQFLSQSREEGNMSFLFMAWFNAIAAGFCFAVMQLWLHLIK